MLRRMDGLAAAAGDEVRSIVTDGAGELLAIGAPRRGRPLMLDGLESVSDCRLLLRATRL
jgi:hypothetical protein